MTGTPTGNGARISVADFVAVALQLALVLVLFRQFQIENAVFREVAALAFGGFCVHALLPVAYRLPFFVLLSVASIALALGFENGGWLLGIGLVLIGICHIPVPFWVRGVLLFGLGGLLAAQRAKLMPFPWSEAIWPILGGMFMFRVIAYFYDVRHDKARATPFQSLAYFFMLPNVCFPLYPVIDYKTFRANYYDDDAARIYQVGVNWMVRGTIQLILYRVVYYYLTLAPSEIGGAADLLRYLTANFLLYLRVSGLFHLIVGLLYLFGFRLPETHNRYLLASSFTDFWRRINIFWKDFMQKVFYYPAVFRLRRFGTTRALIIATMYVFVLTWFLHAYQWFWLRGTVLFVAQDVLFWAILGLLVVVNSLYEIKHGRARSLAQAKRTWRSIGLVTLKTYATFWFICVLWSFWTAESISEWLSMWSALAGPYTVEVLVFPSVILAVILAGSIPGDPIRNVRASGSDRKSWNRERIFSIAAACGLILVSIEAVQVSIGTEIGTFVHTLRSGRLSRVDTAKLERGYYESLLSVERFNSQLWEVYAKKPTNWLEVEFANLKRFSGGFAQSDLNPSIQSDTRWGMITINRWGMRDQDYGEKPEPGTFRAVVLGASSVMGWGVGNGETFEALVESRLNRDNAGTPYVKYELLNMAVPGYDPPQQLVVMDRAIGFEPNAVFYVATGNEALRAARYMVQALQKGLEIPYEGLREVLQQAGVDARTNEAEALKRLTLLRNELLSRIYKSIVERANSRGARAVWIFLPQVREGEWQKETADTVRIAGEAGFIVIDLDDAYRGQDLASVRLAEWDDHPNTLGHRLVAQRLYHELSARTDIIFRPATR